MVSKNRIFISLSINTLVMSTLQIYKKLLMKSLPKLLPDLEDPFLICILTKATKISRGPNTDISKVAPGFILQIDFSWFNLESIRGFTSTCVSICSSTSYPFRFPSRSKLLTLDILKLLVNKLGDYYKKVSSIWVDKYGALARSSEFMTTCNNMKVIF